MSDIDVRDNILDVCKLVKSMLDKSGDKFFSGAEWAALPRLYELCRRLGLKLEWNLTEVGGYQRDFVLSDGKLKFNIEIDGKTHYLQKDLKRDLDLICRGFIVMRIPSKLVNDPDTYEELEREILWVRNGGEKYRENEFMTPVQQEPDGGLSRYLKWVQGQVKDVKGRKCNTIGDFFNMGGGADDNR